jgi:hypothetical protein
VCVLVRGLWVSTVCEGHTTTMRLVDKREGVYRAYVRARAHACARVFAGTGSRQAQERYGSGAIEDVPGGGDTQGGAGEAA